MPYHTCRAHNLGRGWLKQREQFVIMSCTSPLHLGSSASMALTLPVLHLRSVSNHQQTSVGRETRVHDSRTHRSGFESHPRGREPEPGVWHRRAVRWRVGEWPSDAGLVPRNNLHRPSATAQAPLGAV